MRRIFKRYHWFLALQLVLILLCIPSSPRASADGGAPNLAYVAGTPSGVSVIDVGQAKVTKTITLSGDPHMILLSPDGRFLYATQPALGRVAVIAAKTGQVVCAVSLPSHPTVLALSLDATVLYATYTLPVHSEIGLQLSSGTGVATTTITIPSAGTNGLWTRI